MTDLTFGDLRKAVMLIETASDALHDRDRLANAIRRGEATAIVRLNVGGEHSVSNGSEIISAELEKLKSVADLRLSQVAKGVRKILKENKA